MFIPKKRDAREMDAPCGKRCRVLRTVWQFFQRAPPDAPPAAEPTAAPMAAPWSAPLDDSPTENEPAQLERANAETVMMREMRIVFMVVGRLTMIDSNAGHFN